MNWFDIYYSYLEGCRQFNQQQQPERGWDWHHVLPRCLFGDTPFGLYLSKEQHSRASVYQTLAFGHNCTCTWMRKHVSKEEWAMVEGIRLSFYKTIGLIPHKQGTASPPPQPTYEQRVINGRKGGLTNVKTGHIQSIARLGGLAGGKKGSANTNSQLWEDPDHPELGAHHFQRLAKLQRQHNYPSGKSYRRKVS